MYHTIDINIWNQLEDDESDQEQGPVVLPNKDGVHHRQDLVGGNDQRLETSLIKVNARISWLKFNYEHDCNFFFFEKC